MPIAKPGSPILQACEDPINWSSRGDAAYRVHVRLICPCFITVHLQFFNEQIV